MLNKGNFVQLVFIAYSQSDTFISEMIITIQYQHSLLFQQIKLRCDQR